MPAFKKFNSRKVESKHPAFNNPALKLLLEDARASMDSEYTLNQQIRLLTQMF